VPCLTLRAGTVHTYLTRLPMLGAANGARIVNLSSLQELSFANVADPLVRGKARLPIEPAFVAVGPYHAACGLNNSVWFYNLNEGGVFACLFHGVDESQCRSRRRSPAKRARSSAPSRRSTSAPTMLRRCAMAACTCSWYGAALFCLDVFLYY
jgi:hypothetical protein